MGISSITSQFQFVSYKVDRLQFDIKPDLALLASTRNLPADMWDIVFSIRQPSFFSQEKSYVAGLDIKIELKADNERSDGESESSISLSAGIAGLFQVSGERLEAGLEEKIVKNHFPVLLLPYLRSTITSLLANAGFTPFIFPLINLHKLTEDALKDIEVKVIN
jgi:preprotein translocase subunit SecB